MDCSDQKNEQYSYRPLKLNRLLRCAISVCFKYLQGERCPETLQMAKNGRFELCLKVRYLEHFNLCSVGGTYKYGNKCGYKRIWAHWTKCDANMSWHPGY